jgi:hypothetical protein
LSFVQDLIGSLKFGPFQRVTHRASVSDLFKSGPVPGLYVLSFSDGAFYVKTPTPGFKGPSGRGISGFRWDACFLQIYFMPGKTITFAKPNLSTNLSTFFQKLRVLKN